MEVSYLVLLACAVLSMIVGSIWYGPIFGNKWMEIIGVDASSEAARKEMQKGMMPIMLTQFLLTLFQLYVLVHYIKGAADEMTGLVNALWIWAGFIMPTLATAVLWTAEDTNKKWARFLIQAGYQLVMFVIFGYILMNYA